MESPFGQNLRFIFMMTDPDFIIKGQDFMMTDRNFIMRGGDLL